MAISKEIWDKAKYYFETGMSLSNIEKETGINQSSVSKKAKKEGWEKGKIQELRAEVIEVESENSRVLEKKSRVVEKIKEFSLNDFEITMFSDDIRKEIKHDSLIFDTTTLALIRNNELLTRNTKTVMMKVGEYKDGKRIGDRYEPYEVQLSPQDVQSIIDGTDKGSITLNVNQRHAPKQQLAIQNNQIAPAIRIEIEE